MAQTLPVAHSVARGSIMMAKTSLPPGLGDSDGPETATASRERRRVNLAARVAVQEVQTSVFRDIARLENKVGSVLHAVGLLVVPPAL